MSRLFGVFLVLIHLVSTSLAEQKNLPVPRFVTIKFNEVNARSGPVSDCLIEWVFVKKGEPVEVTAEYDQWRKVRDIKGEGGWVRANAISGKRSVVVVAKKPISLLSAPDKYNQIVAKLSPQIRCDLSKCVQDWCKVSCQSHKGWVARKFLWGVYPDE